MNKAQDKAVIESNFYNMLATDAAFFFFNTDMFQLI